MMNTARSRRPSNFISIRSLLPRGFSMLSAWILWVKIGLSRNQKGLMLSNVFIISRCPGNKLRRETWNQTSGPGPTMQPWNLKVIMSNILRIRTPLKLNGKLLFSYRWSKMIVCNKEKLMIFPMQRRPLSAKRKNSDSRHWDSMGQPPLLNGKWSMLKKLPWAAHRTTTTSLQSPPKRAALRKVAKIFHNKAREATKVAASRKAVTKKKQSKLMLDHHTTPWSPNNGFHCAWNSANCT